MQDIRRKYPEVRISFPDATIRSDVVNIRGPKDQVDKVYAQLKKQNSELVASNYNIEVPIFKKFHRNIIGRGGATIKKVYLILLLACIALLFNVLLVFTSYVNMMRN